MVFVTVELLDAKDVKLTLEPKGHFYFAETTGAGNTSCELDSELFDKVDLDVSIGYSYLTAHVKATICSNFSVEHKQLQESKATVGLRTICHLIKKTEKKWWSQLLKQ